MVTCTPKPRPACGAFEVDPRRSIACRAQPVPQLAAEPQLPGTISSDGACDDREYDQAGNLSSHTTTRFEAAIRPTQVITTSASGSTSASFQYDGCGHLVSSKVKDLDHAGTTIRQSSIEYRADGLLSSAVDLFSGRCQRSDFDYKFDDQGRVASVFDPYTCQDLQHFIYDAAGRLSQIDDFRGDSPGPDGVTSQTTYAYQPTGAVREVKWQSLGYGVYRDAEYDPAGDLIRTTTNIGPGGTGSVTTETWTYDSTRRIVSFDRVFDGISCAFAHLTQDFDYGTTGALVRALETQSTTTGPCMLGPDDVTTIAYTRPSADVTNAETKDAAGNVVVRETTTWDAKGHATSLTRAVPPLFAPVRVFQRDFSCQK